MQKQLRLFSLITVVTWVLLTLTFSTLSFKVYGAEYPLQQVTIPERISKIENPDERAIEWLLYLVELGLENRAALSGQVEFIETLWPDTYAYKDIITTMTKIEVGQVKGFQESSVGEIAAIIQSLENSNSLTNEQHKILCLNYILHARLSQHFKAKKRGIEYSYKAINTAEKANFPAGKLFAHSLIVQHFIYADNNLKLAQEHLKKMEVLIEQAPQNISRVFRKVIANNTASVWSNMGQTEKAIETRLQILADENNKEDIQLITITTLAVGVDYYNLEQYTLAEKYMKESIELMHTHNTLEEYEGIALLKLGISKIERKDIAAAKHYTKELDRWLTVYNLVGYHKINYFRLKSELAKADNQLEEAVNWLEKATNERDSLKKIIGLNELIKLEEQSKFSKIQQEKLALEKEKDLNESTIHFQKTLIYGGIIGFSLLLGIYVFFFRQKNTTIEPLDKVAKEKLKTTKTKASTSPVLDQELMQKIEHSLQTEKLYLSQDFTLKKFADHLNSNTSYLSKTINDGFQKNFNTLINDYRVAEVLRLFGEGEHKKFTIESIYHKAGFKSKSSFQKAFKAKTGQTASNYLNNSIDKE